LDRLSVRIQEFRVPFIDYVVGCRWEYIDCWPRDKAFQVDHTYSRLFRHAVLGKMMCNTRPRRVLRGCAVICPMPTLVIFSLVTVDSSARLHFTCDDKSQSFKAAMDVATALESEK
jgi:hypothetical protein